VLELLYLSSMRPLWQVYCSCVPSSLSSRLQMDPWSLCTSQKWAMTKLLVSQWWCLCSFFWFSHS
jgi:hypothetical protein